MTESMTENMVGIDMSLPHMLANESETAVGLAKKQKRGETPASIPVGPLFLVAE